MTLYRLNDWECNYYDDSDFQYAVYDSDTDKISMIEYGSTRYGGGRDCSMIQDPTPEVVIRCQQILEDWLTAHYLRFDKQSIDLPETIPNGARVKLLEDHRNQAKAITVTPEKCFKCDGSGHWVNPRNAQDKRKCFSCDGTGERGRKTYTKVKSADGKLEWVSFSAGTIGVLKKSMMYGECYARGYKQPNRHYLDCLVICDDGREMKVPMRKLCLDKAYMSEVTARVHAKREASGLNFKVMVSGHGGWLTKNFAAEVMKRNGQQSA